MNRTVRVLYRSGITVMVLLFVSCVILSSFCPEHDCTGADCPVCLQLQELRNGRNSAMLSALPGLISAAFLCSFRTAENGIVYGLFTLITQKVKLSD